MTYENIIVEKGVIAVITLNRPDKRNAFTRKMIEEIVSAIEELDQVKETAVIIMKGAGKGFCAGADLGHLSSSEIDIIERRAMGGGVNLVIKAMARSKKIIISQVHGFAMAGGFGIAMSADLMVCTNDVKLGMPEIKRGLLPMNIMSPVSRVMPRRKLMEMMFTGENIDPQQAYEYGIVNAVVSNEEIDKYVRELAEKIARHNPTSLQLGKEAFYNMQDMEFFQSFSYLNEMLMISLMASDSNERINEFLNKK